MGDLQHAQAEYELSKYLQLFEGASEVRPAGIAALYGSLNDRIELTIVRLAVYGIFLVLTDAERLQFVAGGHRRNAGDPFSQVHFDNGDGDWSRTGGRDRPQWLPLFRNIIAFSAPAESEKIFSIPDLKRDTLTANIASVPGSEAHSFITGIPLTSTHGHKIGVICLQDRTGRSPLSTAEIGLLADTGQRCVELLEMAREHGVHGRWTAMQRELDVFLRSRSLQGQLLKGPQVPTSLRSSSSSSSSSRHKKTAEEHEKSGNGRVQPDRLNAIPLSGLSDPPITGGESQRVVDAEIRRNHDIAARDDHEFKKSLTVRHRHEDEPAIPNGETIYRKVFQRAAECLKTALEADGVLFVDGLLGLHGDVQPVAEPEQELHREVARSSVHKYGIAEGYERDSTNEAQEKQSASSPYAHSRIYSSAEYLKGVYVERPTEILGLAGSCKYLDLTQVSKSTLGLRDIDEGFLQRLMDRHPNGAIWHSYKSKFRQIKGESPVDIDLEEEACRLASTFKKARQVIFKPLTDPTSRKRLGACIAWRSNSIPVFTDVVDLRSMKGFLQAVESEIARCDAAHVAKQKEMFVTSVSHELRTPLHGILGAVQLLDDSGLDPTQKSLAKVISTSGSTLHETLTSVLSYAKINQFERRQHEYRQRHPPDTVWALADKQGLASGPDRDYEDLYICTNLALLCEETLGVLEAGKSFNSPHGNEIIVVSNIEHQDNWNYKTEPGAFRRIAVNLIGNALKYTTSGSVIVTLSAAQVIKDERRVSNDLVSGRTLTLTVKDTGKGMSKSFMDHQLFLPFTQEDSTSSHGVGLGMSIVKSLVSLLGGEIEVWSAVHQGTEINVRIPMRMCSPKDNEKGPAAVQLGHDVQKIRERKLATIIYGFPEYVRASLTNYLLAWYDCILLDPTKDAKPDIILVDEGNEDIREAVKENAQVYGKQGVLLSIVMVPSRLGQKMEMIDGYIKWERVPRPLGPSNVGKALLACLTKLDDLQEYGNNTTVDKQDDKKEPQTHEEPLRACRRKESWTGEQYMPSLEKLQISEAPQSSSPDSEAHGPPPDSSKPAIDEASSSAATEVSGKSNNKSVEGNSGTSPALQMLIVDDNALNLKLLGAFFKKNGYLNTKQAKNGKEAVEAVSSNSQGFDIIFMDLSMPVMDGFTATRLIREMETGYERASIDKESVIIALTGLASQEDEDEAFNAGVDLFLTKPVQFPKLSQLLREYEEGTLLIRPRSG